MLGFALLGCAEYPYYYSTGHRASYGPANRTAAVTTVRPVKPRQPAVVPAPEPVVRQAAAAPAPGAALPVTISEPAPRVSAQSLQTRNGARFVLLQNMEAVGLSRSYTGEPSNPDNCAERCVASEGCDAFSFERETKLCFLVRQVTELNSNAAYLSGRLR